MSDHDLSSRSPDDGMTRWDWEQLPENPDPRSDLGYSPLDLEIFEMDGSDQLMVLPRDEDMVREDAFLIADRDAVVDVSTNR